MEEQFLMLTVELFQSRKLSVVELRVIWTSNILGLEGESMNFIISFVFLFVLFWTGHFSKKYLCIWYSRLICPFISVGSRDCRFFNL